MAIAKGECSEITQTIDKITKELKYKLTEKNIELINIVHDSPQINMPISRQKLYLTLLNLMNNAIKHSPQNSTIEFFTKSDGIFIKDHGIGIDPAFISQIGKEMIVNEDTHSVSGIGLKLVSNLLEGSKLKLFFENCSGGWYFGRNCFCIK